jgi:hypothetical protein
MTVWREGVTSALGDAAVDMTLRLDNVGVLPHARSRSNNRFV